MLVSQLFKDADFSREIKDKEIENITDNSQKCTVGSVFVCHKGGQIYLQEALSRGAILVVAEEKVCQCCVVTEDTRKEYARLCSEFFRNSHKHLKLIAVTGTNGKTTTANMLYTILTLSGKKCGLIGSVSNNICGRKTLSDMTTPDCFEMHRMFSELYSWGAEYCIIEASSQGIHQKRLYGLEFEISALTNISPEHLDYHGDMESYIDCKKEIFSLCSKAVINIDDDSCSEFQQIAGDRAVTYSVSKNEGDFVAKSITVNEECSNYALVAGYTIHRINLKLPGEFNIMNSLCAIATAVQCGVSPEDCAKALRSFTGVPGRMEILNTGTDYKIIIDYAHTPEAIKKVLLCLGGFSHNRIITLFGCGGDRDRQKRPEMGRIVSQLSDIIIITNDNPRGEEPEKIIDMILSGMENCKKNIYIHQNRRKAIEYALKNAQKNDIILLAGKGHETCQRVGEEDFLMDEREIVREILSAN